MNIICFSNIDWSFIVQRHHHLMRGFSMRDDIEKIIFVETLGTRSVKINKEDIARGIRKLKNKNSKSQDTLEHKGIDILSPKFIPVFNNIFFCINKVLLKKQLENKIKELQIDINDTVAWVMLPHPTIYKVLKEFNFKNVIYDCIDDVKSFPDIKKCIVESEIDLIKYSDIVTVTSDKLYDYAKKYNSNTYVLKNGVDENIIESNTVVNEIKTKIGYVGTVYEWFDLEIIKLLAKEFNNFEIEIIGPLRLNIDEFKNIKNIKFSGKIPYKEVEKKIREFDVCLIPFKLNNLTLNTNPVKLYEYFAKGKAVVSINLPELREYNEYVYLYNNKAEFIECMRNALNEDKDEKCKKRIEIAKKNTWQKRCSSIIEVINNSSSIHS